MVAHLSKLRAPNATSVFGRVDTRSSVDDRCGVQQQRDEALHRTYTIAHAHRCLVVLTMTHSVNEHVMPRLVNENGSVQSRFNQSHFWCVRLNAM